MPRYIANAKTLLSHENRIVEAGEEFDTVFPKVGGKEMKLSDNIKLVKADKAKPPKAQDNPAPDDNDPDDKNPGDEDPADDDNPNPDNNDPAE